MSEPTTQAAGLYRRVIFFSGRVQGVGFRFTSRNIAMRHNVTGFVKNLPDGRVQLVMEGPEDEMNSCTDQIKERMSGYVSNMQETHFPATGEFPNFSIRHC